MLSIFATVIASVVVATLIGHVVHWMLHKRWSGPFFRGHMEHHLDHYPPGALVSPAYKVPKWHRSGPVLFTPAFLIIVAAAGGLTYLLSLPLALMVTFGVTVLLFGLLNDAVHDSFHVEKSVFHKLPGFASMRASHFLHHHNMRKNFGIIVFAWDRVFGTFRE